MILEGGARRGGYALIRTVCESGGDAPSRSRRRGEPAALGHYELIEDRKAVPAARRRQGTEGHLFLLCGVQATKRP